MNYAMNKLKNLINSFEWIFAKNYANFAPHEYIVLDKENKKLFIELKTIENFEFMEMFYKPPSMKTTEKDIDGVDEFEKKWNEDYVSRNIKQATSSKKEISCPKCKKKFEIKIK